MTELKPLDLTPPPFDAYDWVTFSFNENGSINVAVLREDGELGASFAPDRARLIGLRMIGLAHEIGVVTSNENRIDTDSLTDIMRHYGVEYSDELFAAMKKVADDEDKDADA